MQPNKIHIIAVTSRKGGTGKSTISSHISVFAGSSAFLIDTDSQDTEGSSATWIEARKAKTPHFFSYTEYKKHGIEQLIKLAEDNGATYIIIDTPPSADAAVASVMKFADLIVIVTEPSFLPLKALPRSLAIAHAANKPTLVVINKVKDSRKEAAETRQAFIENDIQFIELNDLADFGRALAEGKAVHEFAPRGKSAQQIENLWNRIKEILK